MDSRALSLAVVALLVTSGCVTPFDDRTTTVTPAAVPEGPSDAFAPGVTAQGLLAPSLLLDAHERSLRDESFTLVVNRTRLHFGDFRSRARLVATVDLANGTRRLRSVRTAVDSPPRTSLLVEDRSGVTLLERTGSGPFENGSLDGPLLAEALVDPTQRDRLRRALDSVVVETVEPERPNAGTYRLSSERPGNLSRILGQRDVLLSVRLDARVDPIGRVRGYNWQYSFIRGRTNVTVLETMRVIRVGSTAVDTTLPRENSTGSD